LQLTANNGGLNERIDKETESCHGFYQKGSEKEGDSSFYSRDRKRVGDLKSKRSDSTFRSIREEGIYP
jgi:hypothetical protein